MFCGKGTRIVSTGLHVWQRDICISTCVRGRVCGNVELLPMLLRRAFASSLQVCTCVGERGIRRCRRKRDMCVWERVKRCSKCSVSVRVSEKERYDCGREWSCAPNALCLYVCVEETGICVCDCAGESDEVLQVLCVYRVCRTSGMCVWLCGREWWGAQNSLLSIRVCRRKLDMWVWERVTRCSKCFVSVCVCRRKRDICA